jgi:hypothetical protein
MVLISHHCSIALLLFCVVAKLIHGLIFSIWPQKHIFRKNVMK